MFLFVSMQLSLITGYNIVVLSCCSQVLAASRRQAGRGLDVGPDLSQQQYSPHELQGGCIPAAAIQVQ